MKLSLKTLYHQGKKISFAHQVLILHFCRNWAVHCHIVIVKMYSRTLAYNYVDKRVEGLGRKIFIFTRGFASKCFKAHKKRQLPGKLSAFQITAITTALHDNKNVKKRKGNLHKAREKNEWPRRGWLWFCIWLVESVVWVFWTNHKAEWSKTIVIPDYFRHSIKNCLIKLLAILSTNITF